MLRDLRRVNMSCKRKIDRVVKVLSVPGTLVSVRSETYGSWDWQYGDVITADTQFPIGSVTKTFTGTLALQAYDERLIPDLDAPISSIHPHIPNGDSITVRQVGSMRSGLYNYTESMSDADLSKEWRSRELIKRGLSRPPYFPPGTDFHYSNTNTVILGSALERLYKKPIHKLVHQRICVPLGLRNTYYGDLRGDNAITGHEYTDGEYIPVDWSRRSWANAAGEIVSTANDMHIYARRSMAHHRTISKNAVRQQRLWQTSEVQPNGLLAQYGFNMVKTSNYIGHNGSVPGCTCSVFADLSTRTTIVVVCNAQTGVDGSEAAKIVSLDLIKFLGN